MIAVYIWLPVFGAKADYVSGSVAGIHSRTVPHAREYLLSYSTLTYKATFLNGQKSQLFISFQISKKVGVPLLDTEARNKPIFLTSKVIGDRSSDGREICFYQVNSQST